MAKNIILTDCEVHVEEFSNPQTGEVVGRAFIAVDPAAKEVYRIPMDVEVAKKKGQELMGIGGIHVANGTDSAVHNALKHELRKRK